MSGADLANLVNEAALHAVRRSADSVHMSDFEAARDRIFMGQRRESTWLNDERKSALRITKAVTQCCRMCCRTPIRCTKSPFFPRVWR